MPRRIRSVSSAATERIAAVERQPGAAQRRAPPSRPLEQAVRLRGPALAPAELGEGRKRRPGPGGPRDREVLGGRLEQGLGVRPGAAPDAHRPVLRAAEGEHVAAAVAVRELRDPIAPLGRAVQVEDRGARADEEAAGPCGGDRDLRFAFERRRGRLVEAAHSVLDAGGGDERRAFESESEHLEIGDAEASAGVGRDDPAIARRGRVSARMGHVSVVEGEPAVLRRGGERVEEPVRAAEPAARDRRSAAEVELVRGQPRRHACSGGGVTAPPVERVARSREAKTHSASSSHQAAQLSPSCASGVSAAAIADSNDARASPQRPSRSAVQPASAGSSAVALLGCAIALALSLGSVDPARSHRRPRPRNRPSRIAAVDDDAIVVGAGLAGLVTTAEPADAGKRVILVDQQTEVSFGGQASGRSAASS